MKQVTLGRTGLKVSPLGFGGAPVGYLDTDQERITEILNTLLDRGVNVIDTAACYPNSEPAIALAVGHRRDEYVLVSKCGHKVSGVRGEEWSARLIEESVERALRRLETDYVDVMLLHSCELKTLREGDALGALIKARDAGKIRFVGYSGDNEASAYAATLPDVAVVETSISICDQRNIDVVLPVARENQVGVIAKRPVANAAWRSPPEQPGIYQSYARVYTERLARMAITPADVGFPGTPARAWPELALRFTLSVPGVHTAIVGTTDPTHVQINLEALEKGPLAASTVEKLREAFHAAEAQQDERWDGET